MLWLLLVALLAMLVGGIFSLPALMATGAVTAIVALTGLKCPSRFLLVAFWVWLEGVFLYLVFQSHDLTSSAFGLPRPALLMLLGVWLAPVLIWPVGFALTFKRWMGGK
ncbi:MAG: hypothetical protein EHM61_09550 [Acidobacteria bacterium]|nr:MAG: hypothetical protein EHM61_09550 [Acidobacteriota bacterium]